MLEVVEKATLDGSIRLMELIGIEDTWHLPPNRKPRSERGLSFNSFAIFRQFLRTLQSKAKAGPIPRRRQHRRSTSSD